MLKLGDTFLFENAVNHVTVGTGPLNRADVGPPPATLEVVDVLGYLGIEYQGQGGAGGAELRATGAIEVEIVGNVAVVQLIDESRFGFGSCLCLLL